MPLSWNEIRDRAIRFSKEWKGEFDERASAQSFWNDFFEVFGVSRRRLASFEKHVHLLGDKQGFIDLLWKGVILVEHKSGGKDLDRAFEQATGYFPGLKDYELPKYVLVSDFDRFRLYECETGKRADFQLSELHKSVNLFGFMAGYQSKEPTPEDPVNVKAAEHMATIHDRLAASGYKGHELEVYLVRVLFCLFGDDTGIFDKNQFQDYLIQRTSEDGSDLGIRLGQLFHVLNTSPEKRQKNLDEQLSAFRYVNGKLFEEQLSPADFNRDLRESLLECCSLDWSMISPAIFGSLFQGVMDPKARRNLGAHYTSEKNIIKLIGPLFLDELRAEFERIKGNAKLLRDFHDKLASLKFLDPACGCGNFLVVTYRCLRYLEMGVLKELYKKELKAGQRVLDIGLRVKVNVNQFYGIEIEEFPSRIAEVALWLTDHQMNNMVSEAFGEAYVRLPLTVSPNIHFRNALRVNWEDIVTKKELSFILGNPPFVGKQYQNAEQKADMDLVFSGVKGSGVLDFVTCWYVKAAEYIRKTTIKVAFVSTNSIAQGEQVGILWNELFSKYRLKIHFAHRTFNWSNEARGKAAVHVVIIGFASYDVPEKRIFNYEDINGDSFEVEANNINPYLVEGVDLFLSKRRQPICSVPEMNYGSMPNDGGHLLLDDEEKRELLAKCPKANKFIKRFVMGEELINSISRWCLWLEDCTPHELREMPEVLTRVEKTKATRLSSSRPTTRELAASPTKFGEVRQPKGKYLAIPAVSSERRVYIPISFLDVDTIAGNKVFTIEGAAIYHFGIITSAMHMTWMRYTSGKLKSDYNFKDIG